MGLRPVWVITLALCVVSRGVSAGDDAGSAPAPDPEQAAALARADVLDKQAADLHGKGRSVEAIALARESLAIREKALPKDDLRIAKSLNNLGALLSSRGAALAEARPLLERALAIREKALGKDHVDVATTLNNLGRLLNDQGAYAEARPLLERSLAIREKALGKDHPAVATSLNSLASLLQDQGDYDQARPLLERSLAIREAALGKDHPAVATGLGNLATLLLLQGAYAEAKPLFERALAIREKAFGKDHPEVAQTLSNLAQLLQAEGAYAQSQALLERSLAIREKVFGGDHPQVAIALNNLGALLKVQGAYAQARPLLERSLAIFEKALGRDDQSVAKALGNLASLLQAQGAYAEARPLLERSLVVLEKALGREHRDVATVLNSLASVLESQGAHAEARPMLERALAIHERALGKEHRDVASDLNNLAELLYVQRAYAEARPLLERSLVILEKALGKDHPEVAKALDNLAALLHALGADAEARPLFERALVSWEKAFGKDHPQVTVGLNNFAEFLQDQKEYAAARPYFERAIAITESQVRSLFSSLSAQQRLALLRSVRYHLDNWLWLAPNVGLSGYREVLQLRGVVARAAAAERVLARRASDEQRDVLSALQAAQRLAARLANDVPSARTAEARATWQRRSTEAAAERERLTLELSKRSAPLRAALERLDLTLTDVQAQVGADTAVVDLLRVRQRYLAWVVRRTGEPARVDVGAAEPIEAAAAEFLRAVETDSADAEGAALRALVWAPIEAKLGEGVKRVVICPDAALAAVPFAALPGREAGRYLLDDVALVYVGQAQDLVPRKDAPPAGRGALVVGGVDYEHAESRPAEEPLPDRAPVLAALDRAPRGDGFDPLPQTRVEAEGLRTRLGTDAATLLLGAEATEARVREGAKGKRILHIATHGFAREDLLKGLYDRKIEEAWLSADAERQLSVGHDPMLLSGLALAGATPREGADGDDGILTALEASYLDLDGVDLVTLSACDTARGTAESGEGVLGLVSAFQMAGARNVVASLWKVDDEATRRLMEGMYERLLRKESPLSPADALREAALALRDSKDAEGKARFAAPRYWAAFVAYGR